MDVEMLNTFKNRVAQLSDSSTNAEWKGIAQMLGDLYKFELTETLTGATTPTLATEQAAMDVDIASYIAEMDQILQN